MKKLFLSILLLLSIAVNSQAAILILSPNGTMVTKPTFTAAAAAADAVGKTIVVTSAYTIDTVTVPSTVAVRFEQGGKLTVNDTKTLTINGPFSAGRQQCFAGTGSVVFSKLSIYEIPVCWFGAIGDGATDDEEVAINKTFVCGLNSGLPVYINPGVYKTGAAILTKVPFRGESGFYTSIKPQGLFAAFDVYECSSGEIKDIYIDFTDVGQGVVDSTCIGMRLMYGSQSQSTQLQLVKFSNIYVYRAYRGFEYNYDGATTFGQMWMVSFEHCTTYASKDYGWYLKSSDGSLNVSFKQCVMEGAYGMDPWGQGAGAWDGSKGFYLYNISNVQMDSIAVARVQASSYGDALYFASIHQLTLTNVQLEGTAVSTTAAPVYFTVCDGISISMELVTSVFTAVAPYIYFDSGIESVVIQHLNEVGVVTGSTDRRFIGCETTNPNMSVHVFDNKVTRALCTINAAIRNAFTFSSDQVAIANEPNAKRQFSWYTATVAGTPTKILDITAFGTSSAPISGLYLVAGTNGSSTDQGFFDVVAIGSSSDGHQAVTAVSSSAIMGFSKARTYTITATELRVSIPDVITYINVTGISQTGLN